MWKECETLTNTVLLSWAIVTNNGYDFNVRILDYFNDIFRKVLIIFTCEILIFISVKANNNFWIVQIHENGMKENKMEGCSGGREQIHITNSTRHVLNQSAQSFISLSLDLSRPSRGRYWRNGTQLKIS
jgi:hypothetical protein